MTFASFNFFLFFPLLVILYYITPAKYRWITLLATSYIFYFKIEPIYALLTASITCCTYLFTRLIENTSRPSRKKTYTIVNILLILSPLLFFKYFTAINQLFFDFFESLSLRWPLPTISLLLPVGISFYTFMAIGYTIDVYYEEIEAEKNIARLALYISFFPLILSGPIERAKNMLPQFRAISSLDYHMFAEGLKMILWGYFMKLVVADRIAMYVDAVYNNITSHNSNSLLFATFLYCFQVYADFGGYSLIAIGISSVLGINVIQNFRRPFFAISMSDFWRRWHISLISWLTHYIYTPLAFYFRAVGIWGIVCALIITFLLSGIWHGARLSFVVWGLIQGLFLSIEALTNKKKKFYEHKYALKNRVWYISLGVCMTFILFAASQIFNRAININDAILAYQRIFSTTGSLYIGSPPTLIYIFIGLSILLASEFMEEFFPSRILLFHNKNRLIRTVSYAATIILILLIGVFDGGEFIYFQF